MDSLSNMAQLAHQQNPGLGPMIVMINAFKNMVYYAQFDSQKNQLIQLVGPDVMHVKDLNNLITIPHLCLGDGFAAYENYLKTNLHEKLIRNAQFSDHPLSSMISLSQASLEKSTWQDLLPIYLRASEAEENLRGIKFTPL